MEPFQLKSINDYASLPSNRERIAVFKPKGLEILITPLGQIFDLEGREIKNTSVLFELEAAISTAVNIKAIIQGVLTSDSFEFEINRNSLYQMSLQISYSNIKLYCYDLVFPGYDVNYKYRSRLDQVEKIIGHRPNMRVVDYEIVTSFKRMNEVLAKGFNPLFIEEVFVYDSELGYRYGPSYIKREAPVFRISSSQKFRSHIRHIIPATISTVGNKPIIVADMLVVNYKKTKMEIPLITNDLALKKAIWDKKRDIKKIPFWFTGFTVFINNDSEIVGKKYDRFIM